jgi:alkylated DNA repair dioxygenase AlkB
MTIYRGVLGGDILESVQFYMRERARTPYMTLDTQSHRLVRHNDPIAVLLHDQLAGPVQAELGVPIKPSYAFMASYLDGSDLKAHRDREQCEYTFDLCVEDSGGGEPWPLYVGAQEVCLQSGDAVLYRGRKQVHCRHRKPDGKVANLIFFHFVDADFAGHLG